MAFGGSQKVLPDRQMQPIQNQLYIFNCDGNHGWNRVFPMICLALVLAGCSYSRGKLAGLPDLACPASPNCVSTQASDSEHRLSPFPYSGSTDSAMSCLKKAIRDIPRSRIVEDKPTSLSAEFQSLIFRFVDDADFRINKTKTMIEFRSTARVGYYDFGVNRRRMENLRIKFRKRCHAYEK